MQQDNNTEDIIKKIINILFINGEEIHIKDLSNILYSNENDIAESKDLDQEKENSINTAENTQQKEIKIIDNSLIEKVRESVEKIGLHLIFSNNKLSLTTNSKYSDLLKTLVTYNVNSDLTPAQLQTLTIIAYLKSVSVSDVSFIRGVQSLQTVRALSTRGLIEKDKRDSESLDNINKDKYMLSIEALQYLGVEKNEDLKDFENIQNKLKQKMEEALNG